MLPKQLHAVCTCWHHQLVGGPAQAPRSGWQPFLPCCLSQLAGRPSLNLLLPLSETSQTNKSSQVPEDAPLTVLYEMTSTSLVPAIAPVVQLVR